MKRTWLIALALVLLPLVVYWPTVFHEYGFRDDYSLLREVRERPGWLMQLTSANGRPVYGVALEASLNRIHDVPELAELRLVGTLLVSLVGVLLWLQLRRSGWSDLEAATVGATTTLLPGAQVVASWAIGWPIALGLVAAVGGFALVDAGLTHKGLRRAADLGVGGALYFVAGLTYQTSALFVIAPLAAGLLLRRPGLAFSDVRWVAAHIGTLFVSLLGGFLVMNAIFSEGVVAEAARMRFEPEPFVKLLWFVRQPLPNSLALFALRDAFVEHASFWIVLTATTALVVAGFRYGATDKQLRLRWLFCAFVLPFVAHSVSLAASSQAIGYRTLLPMSGLFLVLLAFALRAVVARLGLRPVAESTVFGVLVVIVAFLAQRNAFELIAEPQGREWDLMKSAANELPLSADTRVFIARPMVEHRSTERVYADEFGSLSADARWAAEEMFKAAVRQRFPAGLPEGTRYTLVSGFTPPPAESGFDLVLDMRELRHMGDRAPAVTGAAGVTSAP